MSSEFPKPPVETKGVTDMVRGSRPKLMFVPTVELLKPHRPFWDAGFLWPSTVPIILEKMSRDSWIYDIGPGEPEYGQGWDAKMALWNAHNDELRRLRKLCRPLEPGSRKGWRVALIVFQMLFCIALVVRLYV